MVLTALRGALGFLSRLPVGREEGAWRAFRATPAAFPLAGYVLGTVIALPLLLPAPPPTAALAFLAWLYLVVGINNLDGVADLGDAAVVHGDAERRREVMRDTTTGVGAILAVGVVVAGLALAALALAALPPRAAALVIAAEVGAKLGVALLAAFGTASHDGMGAEFTERAGPRSAALPALVALPAAALAWPSPAAAAALLGAVAAALAVLWWARARLGGVGGDAFGAANELARVAALHAGVIAWTRF